MRMRVKYRLQLGTVATNEKDGHPRFEKVDGWMRQFQKAFDKKLEFCSVSAPYLLERNSSF